VPGKSSRKAGCASGAVRNSSGVLTIRKVKIFDPADGFAPFTGVNELTDATVAKRGERWWMYLAGQVQGHEATQLFSASLPPGAPLASSGWKLTPHPNDPTRVAPLAEHERSAAWDLKGGRHCPSYVKGWDPDRSAWVERIYYAGSAENLWGPYAIGYLEWDGDQWVDQFQPAFTANEDWEHGSVYEPNLVYFDGKWRMWYVAGSNLDDYLVQGFAESANGTSHWSRHEIFVPAEEKVFDFRVVPCEDRYEAVFARIWMGKGTKPPKTGLWWCESKTPSSRFSDWSNPVQIMTAEDCGWHSGPWKPSVHYGESDPRKMLIFFDGIYQKNEPGPFPFALTLGCLEIERPL